MLISCAPSNFVFCLVPTYPTLSNFTLTCVPLMIDIVDAFSMQNILYQNVPSWAVLTLVSAGGNKGIMKVLERNRLHLIPAFSVFLCDLHGR